MSSKDESGGSQPKAMPARPLAPNLQGIVAYLESEEGLRRFQVTLEATHLFSEAQVQGVALEFRQLALSSLSEASPDLVKVLSQYTVTFSVDAIYQLARMGCPFNPKHGLGFLVEKKNSLIAVPGIRAMERIVQSDSRVTFMQSTAIRQHDQCEVNLFDPTCPPLFRRNLTAPEPNPIIGGLATIKIGDVYHSVLIPLSHAALQAEKGYMNPEDRARYRAHRAACREVINRYMRSGEREESLSALVRADEDSAEMLAAQQSTQPAPVVASGTPPALSIPAAKVPPLPPAAIPPPAPSASAVVAEDAKPAEPAASPLAGIMDRRGEVTEAANNTVAHLPNPLPKQGGPRRA